MLHLLFEKAQDVKYIGQNFLSNIVPIAIGLTTAGIALHNEIPLAMFTTPSSTKTTFFSSKYNPFNYIAKHVTTHKHSFIEKAYDNAITDLTYPLVSNAASLIASKEQYSLLEKTYTKAMFLGIISTETLNIYSCITTPTHGHSKIPNVTVEFHAF